LPLRTEQQHAETIEYNRQHDPDFHKPADKLPYGVFVCDDKNQTQVLFDYSYRPMWKRSGENPAVRADPHEWFDWSEVFWFYDHSLRPDNCPRLAEATAAVLNEFVSGGLLYVRRWQRARPDLVAGTLIGKIVERVRTDSKSGLKVIENMEVN
jgi:hypothetical protein